MNIINSSWGYGTYNKSLKELDTKSPDPPSYQGGFRVSAGGGGGF